MKTKLTYAGAYKATRNVEQFNNTTGEVETVSTKVNKFLYTLEFSTEADKQKFVAANSTESYSPLQADGTVRHTANTLFAGLNGKGSAIVLEAIELADGKFVFPTSSEEDLEMQSLIESTLAGATDPQYKAQLASELAKEQRASIADDLSSILARKRAKNAKAQAELASFGKETSTDAKASKDAKLDVK
jgi:hypothetical protein